MTILTRILLGLALVTGVPAVQLQAGTGCPPAGCDSGCSSSCLEGCAKEVTNIKIKEGVSIKNYYCRAECCPGTDDGLDGDAGGNLSPLDLCDAPGQPLLNCVPDCVVADNEICMPSVADSSVGECVLKVPTWVTDPNAPRECTYEECNTINGNSDCVEGQICEVYHDETAPPTYGTIFATCVTPPGPTAPLICDTVQVGNPDSCGDFGECFSGDVCLSRDLGDGTGEGLKCYADPGWTAEDRQNRVDCEEDRCDEKGIPCDHVAQQQCKVFSGIQSPSDGITYVCVDAEPDICLAGLSSKIVIAVGQSCTDGSNLGACGPDEMCVKVVDQYGCYVDGTGYSTPWPLVENKKQCEEVQPCIDLGDSCQGVCDKECKVSLGSECSCCSYVCKLWTVTLDTDSDGVSETTEIKSSCESGCGA